jgi:hypothetical protein
MSKVISIKKQTGKPVLVVTPKQTFTIVDFFAPYQDDTNEVFLQFLNELYGHYLKTDTWKDLDFGDKAEMDFKYQILRDFLKQLQR